MKKLEITLGTLLLLTFAAAACSLLAQDKTPPTHESFIYNNSDQITVEGTIQEVKDYKCPVSGSVGSHIAVKNATETIEVHLAPAAFLKDYEMTFHAGETVKIVGVKIQFEGKPALLAKTVRVGQATFTFRDNQGKPLW
jgi:DNA/RNA endonuclease YhcR with UshA esterase domain